MRWLVAFFVVIKTTFSFSTIDEYTSYKPPSLEAKDDTSDSCRLQLDEYGRGLADGELWAWNMLDSSSKIPSGFLTGNTKDIGNFHQCLGVNHDGGVPVKGKYCFPGVLYLLPMPFSISRLQKTTWPNISLPINVTETFKSNQVLPQFRADSDYSSDFSYVIYYMTLCIPDQCRPTELNFPLAIWVGDDFCQTTEREFVFGDYIGIAFFFFIILLMIVSTIYSLYLSKKGQKPAHPLLLCYSVKTNGEKLLTLSYNPRNLTCFGGLRFISILWVILGHRYVSSGEFMFLNKNDIQTWKQSLYSQYVQAAQYAVDTFLVLGGCLISYGTLIPMHKLKSRMENMKPTAKGLTVIASTLSAWLTRYLRITPSLFAVYVVYVTFQRHLSSGPVWNLAMDSQRETCLENWWSFFLYIENYVHTDNMCLVHGWYLHVDMQLYIFSPILMWLLVYLPRITPNMIIPVLTVIATLVTWLIAYINDIEWYTDDFYNLFYYVTHTRIAPWLIGLLLGIFLCEYKEKEIKINKYVNWTIWVIVLAGFVALILCQHDATLNHERIKTSIWTALHKPAWAIGVCWVIFACVTGYGGIINTFLSLPAFQILGRLVFCMYLVHFFAITPEIAQSKVIWYFSDFNLFYKFLADVVLTIFIAAFWVLAFESPMIAVERFLTGKGAVRKEKENLLNSVQQDRKPPEEVVVSKL